jgi:hypothetical protein
VTRTKASINVDIWGDASFRDLTDAAQSLWFKLQSHPKLDYAGVTDFHPGKLAAATREQTADDIMIAAQELSDAHWCVFDQSTDEVMVRGYLRHDGVLLQSKLPISVAKDYAAVASNKIRAVVVFEIQRFRKEHPDLAAWEKPQMKTLLKQPAVPVTETETGLDWAFAQPFGQAHDRGYGQRYDQAHDRHHDQPDRQDHGQDLGTEPVAPTTGASTATATSTATTPISKEISDTGGSSYPHQASEVSASVLRKRVGAEVA